MGFLATLNHLLNFVAPAAALALALVLGARFGVSRMPLAPVWWAQLAIHFAVGCAVLLGGLVLLGRDGKMLTYAALVLAMASCQWLLLRGWRG
ncbi:MAG: hypothetical protein PHI55_04430 [Burkholderiaceae bacterium]|nr:hypothetical protein [Burkholderiaceae bacterium]